MQAVSCRLPEGSAPDPMPSTVRFAPSPTGRLHLGNARTALVNWLFARAHDGRFILRLDDTDAGPDADTLADAIRADLRWLGLGWDLELRQSDRGAIHTAAFHTLRAGNHVYACYETPEELTEKRRALARRGRPPVYDRAALRLSDDDRARLEAEGRRPHWRLRLPDHDVVWIDLVQGQKTIPDGTLSDPVVLRADGRPTYTLATAVDDRDLGITHVIRGEDHVTNTGVQIPLIDALRGPIPAFAHLPLISDASGRSLSKRDASLSLAEFREHGIEPLAIASLLATLGTGAAPHPVTTLDDLVGDFDLARYGRARLRLDVANLHRLSAETVRAMPFENARPRLAALGLGEADAVFWEAVRPNLERLDAAADWWWICRAPFAGEIVDADYLALAADALEAAPATDESFDAWIASLKAKTGRKGRALFQPLRLALTGREHGPELRHLLTLIGRDRAAARLRGACV
jgi:glutamyl-tRNA synthetase